MTTALPAITPALTPTLRVVPPRLPLPRMRGLMDRRILINFRVDPGVLAPLLPSGLRPLTVGGAGVAGICLLRLRGLRPDRLPVPWGAASENSAHRIAVQWEEAGCTRSGVFILHRHTDSIVNRLAGGRIFPGVHHPARFEVWECPTRWKICMTATQDRTRIRVAGRLADAWPAGSVFATAAEAGEFFARGAVGWSRARGGVALEAMELGCRDWRLEPLVLERVESSVFSDTTLFPRSSVIFDSAFLMRNIPHEWRATGTLQPQAPS